MGLLTSNGCSAPAASGARRGLAGARRGTTRAGEAPVAREGRQVRPRRKARGAAFRCGAHRKGVASPQGHSRAGARSLTRALCSPLPFARVCSSLAGTSGGTWSFVPSLDMPAAATSKAQELARLQLGWVLADVAEQLHEAALHAAVLQLHLGEPVPLAPAWRTEWAAAQVVVGRSGLRRTLSRVWPPSCG